MRTTMTMATVLLVGLAGGALLGNLATGDAAAGEDAPFLGSARGRSYEHAYKMPLDVGVDGQFKPGDRVEERRTRVHVPNHYGEMIDILPVAAAPGDADKGTVVLWFKAADGILRNAVIEKTATRLLHIEFVPTKSIAVSYR